MNKYIVYALCEPVTGCIRYIGKSCNGMQRPKVHLQPSTYNNERLKGTPVYHWIRELVINNTLPTIKILDICSSRELVAAKERELIRKYRSDKLLNVRDGGEGGSRKGCRKVKPLTHKQRIKRGRVRVQRSDGVLYASQKLASESINVHMSAMRWALDTGRAIRGYCFARVGESFGTKVVVKHNRRVLRSDGVIFPNLRLAAESIGVKQVTLRSSIIQSGTHRGYKYVYLTD